MPKIIINNLYIEVTRKCNMNCNHCLRGEKENENLSLNDINKLFDNEILKIKNLTITGGEPTLNIKAILQIIKNIISNNIFIDHFVMVINGSIYNQSLIDELNNFYNYYQKNYHHYPKFFLICSQDQFHLPPKEENIKKYRKLPYFKSNYVNLSKEQILNVGKAYENNLGNEYSYIETMTFFDYYKNNNYPNIIKENEDIIKLDELYLSSKGLYSFHIIDVPFKQIDELCIYDINQINYQILKTNEEINSYKSKRKQ